jgi:hypothetical protein
VQHEEAAPVLDLSRLALQEEQQSGEAAAAAAAEAVGAGDGYVWLHMEAAFQACIKPC